MKCKNIEIINMMNFLTNMSDKKLPQKIGYAIVRNLSMMKHEYDIYVESLSSLIKNYKEHIVNDKNGNQIFMDVGVPMVDDSVKDEYIKELNDLLSIEVDIEIFKIPEEVFDYDGEKYDALSVKEIMLLIDIFCESLKVFNQ